MDFVYSYEEECKYIFNVTPTESGTIENDDNFENWGGRISSMKKLIEKQSTKQREEGIRRMRLLEEKIDDTDAVMREMVNRIEINQKTIMESQK